MKTAQLKKSICIAWLIISVFILIILITPFVLSKETIHLVASQIKTPHENRCLLCGMTTSFINISNGKFEQALAANQFGIYFFIIFLVNELVICYILFRKLKFFLLKDRRFNL
jgi:hypothetical protein